MTEQPDAQSVSQSGSQDDEPERLEVPAVVEWPIFPFEGDMRVRKLEPYTEEERIRQGDPGGEPCDCGSEEVKPDLVWSNDRWRVRPMIVCSGRVRRPTRGSLRAHRTNRSRT